MSNATTPEALAADITATLGASYKVTVNDRGWIDIKVNPANAIGDPTKFDFFRIAIEDEAYYRVIHLTHNEVLRGDMTLTNSMTGLLHAAIRELCDSTF